MEIKTKLGSVYIYIYLCVCVCLFKGVSYVKVHGAKVCASELCVNEL